MIIPFADLDSSQVAVAGGKGASLGELTRAGAPVPPGFVISSSAFTDAIHSGDHQRYLQDTLSRLNGNEIEPDEAAREIAIHLESVHVVEDVASAIQLGLETLGVNSVSVRSSATCEDSGSSAWAGQLETYLNVPPEHVVGRVRDCWMSMFSPQALAYGAVHGYGAGQFAVAVVVQQMVASEISGIGFSVHPVTQEPNIMLIEACLGLGEAIVSGQINPDQYVVERDSDRIIASVVGEQRQALYVASEASPAQWRELGARGSARKISDEQVVEYARLLSRIHHHYGHPMDTEWAIENDQFQVLQARPITTLAAEYQESLIDLSTEWQPIVRRPQSLIEVSIASHWIDAQHAHNPLGIHFDRELAVQDQAGMAQLFQNKEACEACFERVKDAFQKDRALLLEMMQHGQQIYRNVQSQIDQGPEGFNSLDEAAEFFAEVAQYTTIYPFWVLNTLGIEEIDDPELRGLAEELRSRSLYPTIERKIIDPYVARLTADMGFSAPDEAPNVVTWSELRRGSLDRDELESRLQAIRDGHRFIFQSIDGEDQVHFVKQTEYLLMRLAKQRQVVPRSDKNQLTGSTAWPGHYTGRARVILSPDTVGQTFEEGEVLVSIQSSPALMPFLTRCGAIITDDGGIACHAAIIARELCKPTLIGTGRATSTIHTGDLVEVDTYSQVVRILERV
ncbi:Phosphoenolpyruvate synthase [Symmachiella macrocystis]|uniref:Phosphoenolpyruvate synthase n=1 Tax=Symmachiella macrocystis TaxID=2527985 RepID=A0A5C6BKL8_9PLAN|nr:PEP/pyruvate-binding domain-containing protein [Symmachiella macrocystis]TWU12525.1 Phosphoenolpyruvate synthase [Symmachiella macrocystis]